MIPFVVCAEIEHYMDVLTQKIYYFEGENT